MKLYEIKICGWRLEEREEKEEGKSTGSTHFPHFKKIVQHL